MSDPGGHEQTGSADGAPEEPLSPGAPQPGGPSSAQGPALPPYPGTDQPAGGAGSPTPPPYPGGPSYAGTGMPPPYPGPPPAAPPYGAGMPPYGSPPPGGYGAPGYGAPGYGAPGYGAPAYGGGPYGSYGAPSGPVLANPGRRLGQYLLDGLLAVVTLFIGWFIWSLFIWRHGETPGMQILRMKVVKADTGQPATWGTMALREIVGKFLIMSVPTMIFRFLGIVAFVLDFMLLWDSRNQQVWDKVARTVVIDNRVPLQ